MATIVTRAGKGSPLTNAEVDQNFLNLNSAKLEAGDLSSYLLSATAASTYQTILGFTPYNATNPSNYITSAALTTYAPLASPTFTGTASFGIAKPTALQETKVAMAANNIDLATGNLFTKTISGATTLTVSNVPASGTVASLILDVTNAGTNITWWANVKWPSGLTPVLTTVGRDALGFFTHDGGTTWTGVVLGKDIK